MLPSEKRLLAAACLVLAGCSVALFAFLELTSLGQLRSESRRLSDRIGSLKIMEAKSIRLLEEYRSLKEHSEARMPSSKASAKGDAISSVLRGNGVAIVNAQVRMDLGSISSVAYTARGSPQSLLRALKDVEGTLGMTIVSLSIDSSSNNGEANASFSVRY